MLALGIKLLGIGRWLKDALGAVLRAILAHPKEAAIITLLGGSVWLWRGWNGEIADHKADNIAHKAQLERIEAQSQANLAAALAQVRAVEAKSAELAKDADHAHELALQDARSATARFAAANRINVQPGKACLSPAAPAAPERNDPGLPADLPPDPGMVAIRETELQELVTWSTVGIEAHNHAVEKINAGLAKVPEGWPEPAF